MNDESLFYQREVVVKDRAIIFLDHGNVFHNLLLERVRIDYQKFMDLTVLEYNLVGAIIYLGVPPNQKPEREKFIKYLESLKVWVQKLPIKVFPDGRKKQKRIDTRIHGELVDLANEDAYDVAILVSGDADFIDAVIKIKKMGKRVNVWSFERSLSNQLREVAGEGNVHFIDGVLEEITVLKIDGRIDDN